MSPRAGKSSEMNSSLNTIRGIAMVDEYVTMDEETEDLALALTHLIKGVSSKVDCGETYNIIAEFPVHFLHEPVHPLEAEEYGRQIRLTRGSRNIIN